MKKFILAALMFCFSQPLFAAANESTFFGELGVGAGFGSTDLKFYNPTGTLFTSNTTSGNYINLANASNSNCTFVGYGVIGYKVNSDIFVRTSYNYFGKVKANGGAVFGGLNFDQAYETEAHALLVGAGTDFDLAPSVFAEITGDIGLGLVSASGTQGANLGRKGVFPSESHTNFAWGIGGGLGYHIAKGVSLVSKVNYYHLGNASTAQAGPAGVANGMHTDERLETKLSLITTTLGLRFDF